MAIGRRKKKMPSNRLFQPPLTRNSRLIFLVIISLFAIVLWVFSTSFKFGDPIAIHSVEVVNAYPHDRTAFTQGLVYAGNDTLFESTGLYGQSSIRKVNLQTGKIEVLHRMGRSYFGEGLTLLGNRLLQVTWLRNIGFIYDRYNLSELGNFVHEMRDGWGLATDGKTLFGTDGTSTLYHIDPQRMKVIEKHVVKYKGEEVNNLNELEFVNGEVWANVWQTDCIARISYKDGAVLGWIILSNLREGLLASGERDFDVLNGIAWNHRKNIIYVTGKLWPKLYEIKLQPWRKSARMAEDTCMRSLG